MTHTHNLALSIADHTACSTRVIDVAADRLLDRMFGPPIDTAMHDVKAEAMKAETPERWDGLS